MSEIQPFFTKSVDTTNRQAMIDFLTNHFRYDTMNSWNNSTSYANNVKVYNLGIEDPDVLNKAWNIICSDIDCEEMYENFHEIINDFRHAYHYDIGFNGRSDGYLVLYSINYDPASHISSIYPGKSIDQDEDFTDEEVWTMEQLKARCDLICAFDRVCDRIRHEFIYWCRHSFVVEHTNLETSRYLTLSEED